MTLPEFGRWWLWLLATLVLAAYVVPYGFLRDIESFVGAFAFWLAFGITAVGLLIGVVSRWRV